MPNWCSTTYVFKGKNGNEKGFEIFKNEMIKFLSESPNTDEGRWLGTLAKHFGFDIDNFPYGLRGWISYYEDNGDYLTVDVEDAWVYHNGIFEMILENYFPQVDYVMTAEEPGCEIYVNTDTDHEYLCDMYCLIVTDENDNWVDSVYCDSNEVLEKYKEEWKAENPNYDFIVHPFESDYGIY